MADKRKKNVGVLFGGRSVEHEVSVITGIQAANALDKTSYRPIPIYISKDGDWYTGEHLLDLESYKDLDDTIARATLVRPAANAGGGMDLISSRRTFFSSSVAGFVDVVLLAMHGSEGENGALQGTLEMLNVPYTGSDVTASAIGMDKSLSKTIARTVDVPVLDQLVISDSDWTGNEDDWLNRSESRLGFPVIIKPMRLGSSIGIAVAEDQTELESILEDTFRLDSRALLEPCIVNLREFNCAVLLRATGPEASAIEEPVRLAGSDMLSFEQKYQRGGAKRSTKNAPRDAGMASLDRIIPADVPGGRDEYLQDLAVKVFSTMGCGGVARIDFLYDTDNNTFYFNEINTIPGSFSFYLWKETDILFDQLLDELIDGAIRDKRSRNAKLRSYETNLLAANALTGVKT